MLLDGKECKCFAGKRAHIAQPSILILYTSQGLIAIKKGEQFEFLRRNAGTADRIPPGTGGISPCPQGRISCRAEPCFHTTAQLWYLHTLAQPV